MGLAYRTPTCSSQTCERYHDDIGAVCRDNHWPPGKPILLCLPDGSCCNCSCPGPTAGARSADVASAAPPPVNQVPDCRPGLCDSDGIRDAIAEVCRKTSLPPDQPVLVADPETGRLCKCYCR